MCPSRAYAHKFVLALSSPVFVAMFSESFSEGAAHARGSGRTVIQMADGACPFSCDAFKLVLRYLYTGVLPTASKEGRAQDDATELPYDEEGSVALAMRLSAEEHLAASTNGADGRSARRAKGAGGTSRAGGTGGAGGASGGGIGGGGRAPEPLRPTDEGVGRLLEVLQAADYLELAHLKQLGERLIVDWEVLQVENCLAVFERACATRCDQLRASCVQFIRGMFDVIKETEQYQELPEELRREVQELRAPVQERVRR